jgi:hypothetical protein
VISVEVTGEHAFVTAALLTYLIPRRAFPDDASFDDFVTGVRDRVERHGPAPGDAPTGG